MDEKQEQEHREQAINRRLAGEKPRDIYRSLNRSKAWFDKWWAVYRHQGREALKGFSRAAHRIHNKMPQAVEDAIVRIRRILEERTDPELKYAFIGAATIQGELKRTPLRPLPSIPAIDRALKRRGLIHPHQKRSKKDTPKSYYPAPPASGPNEVHQMDIVSRRIQGYGPIYSFHLIDLARRKPVVRQYASKGAVSAKLVLVTTWQSLGRPRLLQIDNEATFCGGYRGRRVISQVVRLCLSVGVEVLFIPFYDPERNGVVESFNDAWDEAFWQRERWRDLAHVQAESPIFERWYRSRYYPPELKGKTPDEMFPDFVPQVLPTDFTKHQERLSITAGFIHFIRLVSGEGQIVVLNEAWTVDKELAGEYVWATVSTKEQVLRIYHQKDAQTDRRQVTQYEYPLSESVVDLDPVYQRR
jgi:transposase InsO family protein